MAQVKTPEAVVFDIGNVLIEWQPERFYDAVIGDRLGSKPFDTMTRSPGNRL